MRSKIEELLNKTEQIVSESKINAAFKPVAFSEVFKILWFQRLKDKKKQVTLAENYIHEKRNSVGEGSLEEFAQVLGIEKNKLQDIYLDQEGRVKLVRIEVPGKKNAAKQVNIAALILYPKKILGNEWIKASKLAKFVGEMGIYDRNFSRNIKRRSDIFTITGSRKGVMYRLTTKGEKIARQLIETLLK